MTHIWQCRALCPCPTFAFQEFAQCPRGRGIDFKFLDCSTPFCFLLIEFNYIFNFFIIYYHIMFIITVFWAMINRRTCFLRVSALLFSILAPLFLPSSSVYLSDSVLAVPMRKCLGKHLCTSFPFLIAILNGASFFARRNSIFFD